MKQSDKTMAKMHVENLNSQLKQVLKKYTPINAKKPTAEGLTQEILSIFEDFYKRVGLPMYQHTDEILMPTKLRDDFLLEEKMAIQISKDAGAVINLMRNDTELNKLLSYFDIDTDSYKLKANIWDYKIDLRNLINSSENDLIAMFYISSLKASKEYIALNKYVKEQYGNDKNLEDIETSELIKKMGQYNAAFNLALNDYKRAELATKVCIQKAKVITKDLDPSPAEKEMYEKYLLSDAHKKHMQDFEKTRGISYVEHEVLQLKAVSVVVNFDKSIKSVITKFVETISKEEIDSQTKNEAARLAHDTSMTCLSISLFSAFELATVTLTLGIIALTSPAAIAASLPIVAVSFLIAAAAVGISGSIIAYELEQKPERYQQTASENVLNEIAKNNTVYNNCLENITNTSSLLVGAMQELEAKQSKAISRS